MTDTARATRPLPNLTRSLFLVWGPPSHGPRSSVFASELGIPVHFLHRTKRRGLLVAPFKYAYQAIKTITLLWRERPEVVFVQSPPSLAVLMVAIVQRFIGGGFIVDAHTDALLSPIWTRPRWLQAALARRAIATLVTGNHFAEQIRSIGAQAVIVRDIPTEFTSDATYPMPGGANVAVVATFASDEPLAELLEAASALPDVTFHITGDPDRATPDLRPLAPPNVRFTGFVPRDQYVALLRDASMVVCLTTRPHTMQRGACEALSMGRPLVTSSWDILEEYFAPGAVFVDNSPDGIRSGVEDVLAHEEDRVEAMTRMRSAQLVEWQRALADLDRLVGGGEADD